jgi:hypothetical protein
LSIGCVKQPDVDENLFSQTNEASKQDMVRMAPTRNVQRLIQVDTVLSFAATSLQEQKKLLAAEDRELVVTGEVRDEHVSQSLTEPVQAWIGGLIFEIHHRQRLPARNLGQGHFYLWGGRRVKTSPSQENRARSD